MPNASAWLLIRAWSFFSHYGLVIRHFVERHGLGISHSGQRHCISRRHWFNVRSCKATSVSPRRCPNRCWFFDSDCAFFGGAAIVFLQILMVLTGNHARCNWFTLALCLLLLDDHVLMKSAFSKLHGLFVHATRHLSPVTHSRWPKAVIVPRAIVVAVVDAWLSPLRTRNGCGRFAVTTTDRREFADECLPPISLPE